MKLFLSRGFAVVLVVVYKELNNDDGFIITAFLTRKVKQFESIPVIRENAL